MVLAEISPSEGCQDSHITVRYNQLTDVKQLCVCVSVYERDSKKNLIKLQRLMYACAEL